MARKSAGRETLTYLKEFRLHWPNLLGASVGMALGAALNHYMTSMFGPAMIADLGWAKADFALIGSLPLITMLLIPFAGMFADRFGPRTAAIVGFTAMSLGFVAMSFMRGSLIEYFAIYAMQHVFGILTTTMVFARVIVERFDASRGIALSVMMSAPPLAGAIAAPLMGEMIDTHGWRAGYMAMAVICALGGLIAIPFISRGREKAPVTTKARPKLGEVLALVRNRTFLLVLAGMFLVNIPQVFASSQLKLVVMDSGISSDFATWMVSLYALGVIVGRFMSGLALDRIEPHLVAIAALGLPAVGFLIMASSIAAPGLIVLAVMLVGLAQGAEADIGAYLISRRFDMQNFSLMISLMTMMIGLGSAVGSLVLSFTLRINESYVSFLLVSAVATVIGAMFFAIIGPTRRGDERVSDEDEALLQQAVTGELG